MSLINKNFPDHLYSVAQVRKLDRIAIEELGISGDALMQRAAEFSYAVLKKKWPDAKSIAIVCGRGNNAGDGYVLAKLAFADNKQVSVINLFEPNQLKGEAKTAYHDFLTTKLVPILFSSAVFDGIDVVVDAIFGTGLERTIEGRCRQVINEINSISGGILALDVPSGLNGDTGKMMGVAVQATVTATFIGLKQGLFTADGSQCSGDIAFNSLGVPPAAYQILGEQSALRLRLKKLQCVLKSRPRNSHKGHFGHVLVVGGDEGYLGAARMTAEAAARVGAGLISIATHASHASIISTMRPEIMSHGVATLKALKPLIRRADVIAIGPGLGQSEWAKSLLACVLESSLSLVIDADGLNLLAEETQSSEKWVLTPHPGEAARLLGSEPASVQADRFRALGLLHEKYRGAIVLKGCGTLIADTKGQFYLCDAGNPGMSSGGMGDVLTGVIAGLIAQGIELNHATKLGVCLHAQAADQAAHVAGERGLLALDLMPYLRHLVNP